MRPLHAAALLYLLLAAALVAPVLPDPTRLALGHPNNDVWNHVWGFGFVARALLAGELPIRADELVWPVGGRLWFIDTFNAVLTLPAQLAWGPVAAYNLSCFANLALCGLGAHLLARAVTGSDGGAVFAGVAYMTAPHLLGQAYNGISETLAAGWLPLALLAARAAFAEPTPRRAAIAGLAFGVNAVANWYYGLFAGLALAGMVLWGVVHGWRALAPLRAAGLLAVGVAVCAVVMVGPFGLFLSTMEAEDAVVTRDPGFVWMTLVMHNMTDLVSLLRPGRFYSPDLKAMFDEDLIVVVYLGWALVLPALAALWSTRARDASRAAWMTALYLSLSLGPFLYVGGAYVDVAGRWIPLPFLFLFRAFPLFSRISHAYRFAIGATLGLALLGAWAVRAAERRGAGAWALVAALCVARVVETAAFSPAHVPIPTATFAPHAVYAQLDGGAVLDLPITMPVLSRARWIANQLVHGEAVPYGLNDPLPLYLYVNRYTRYLVELERSPIAMLPPQLPVLDLVAAQAELRDRGLRWIVVNKARYPAPTVGKISRFLDLSATPVFDDTELRVYVLDAPGGAADGQPAVYPSGR